VRFAPLALAILLGMGGCDPGDPACFQIKSTGSLWTKVTAAIVQASNGTLVTCPADPGSSPQSVVDGGGPCEPDADDGPCVVCLKESCCAQSVACGDDAACGPGATDDTTSGLVICAADHCATACPRPQ
jgi:hypothetical protein